MKKLILGVYKLMIYYNLLIMSVLMFWCDVLWMLHLYELIEKKSLVLSECRI